MASWRAAWPVRGDPVAIRNETAAALAAEWGVYFANGGVIGTRAVGHSIGQIIGILTERRKVLTCAGQKSK